MPTAAGASVSRPWLLLRTTAPRNTGVARGATVGRRSSARFTDVATPSRFRFFSDCVSSSSERDLQLKSPPQSFFQLSTSRQVWDPVSQDAPAAQSPFNPVQGPPTAILALQVPLSQYAVGTQLLPLHMPPAATGTPHVPFVQKLLRRIALVRDRLRVFHVARAARRPCDDHLAHAHARHGSAVGPMLEDDGTPLRHRSTARTRDRTSRRAVRSPRERVYKPKSRGCSMWQGSSARGRDSLRDTASAASAFKPMPAAISGSTSACSCCFAFVTQSAGVMCPVAGQHWAAVAHSVSANWSRNAETSPGVPGAPPCELSLQPPAPASATAVTIPKASGRPMSE